MKIYVDAIFFINFSYDSYLLKEHTSMKRLLLGALIGALAIIFLFLPIHMVTLFFIKIMMSILMILGTFSYGNKKIFLKRLGILYLTSCLLGGTLYMFQDAFAYEKSGILFLRNETTFHFLFLFILGPMLFFQYLKQFREERQSLNLRHHIEFQALGKNFQVEGYLDTGNQLKDPYHKRSVLLIYEKDVLPNIEEAILVPFQTAKGNGIVRCVVPKNLTVDGKNFRNYLVGFLEEKIEIDGRSCILPNQMREELE